MPDTAATVTPAQTEAAFVESFAAKLEAKAEGRTVDDTPAAPAKAAAATKDDKTEKGDKKEGKAGTSDAKSRTTSTAKSGTSDSDTDDAKIASSAAADDESDDADADEDDTDSDTDADDEDDSAADDEDSAGDEDEDVDDEDDAGTDDDAEADDKSTADDKDDTKDDDAADADAVSETTQEALKRHGLKLTLDDIPAEARPLVQAKLANIDAAFSRAQAEARAYRTEEAAFRAEQKFATEHPELAIVELIEKYPDAFEKVNALLTKVENADGKKVVAQDTAEARKTARAAVDAEIARVDRIWNRATEIDSYTKRACQRLNIPYEVVRNAVVIALNEKPDDKRDLSTDELDTVISSQHRLLGRRTSAIRREERKRTVQERTKDRKIVSPAGKVNSGAAALAPAGKKAPKTDAEFAAHMEAKYAGGRK